MPTKKLKGTDHIYGRFSADGRLTSYQVKIRKIGFPVQNASFDELEYAERFVRVVLKPRSSPPMGASTPAWPMGS